MNYMKMVAFTKVTIQKSSAVFIFKNSEEVNIIDNEGIVPGFMILEAIFQTAGKVAREYSGNTRGAYVVSFSGMKMSRILFSYELLLLHAELTSMNQANQCFFLTISAFVGDENILQKGRLILKQSDDIKTDRLNNCSLVNQEEYLEKMGFK